MTHEQTTGPGPRAVLRFRHLHTNEVQSVQELCQVEEGKILYSVEIKGKPRPMLVLWQGHDGVFHTFLMTKKSRAPKECQVMVTQGSFVDCSRIFQYNDVVLDHQKHQTTQYLDPAAWQKVMMNLRREERDCITYVELGSSRLGAAGTNGDRP